MKKISVYLLCVMIAVCSVVPCFAAETQAAAIDNTGVKDLGTATVLPEASATLPGSSTLQPVINNTYTLNGATVGLEDGTEVNLSGESIDALAKAIAQEQAAMAAATYQYSYQYNLVFTYNDVEYTFVVDTNEADFTDYHIVVFIDNKYKTFYLLIEPDTMYYSSNYSIYYCNGFLAGTHSLTSGSTATFAFDSVMGLTSGSNYPGFFAWSNEHCYSTKTGDLLYSSSYSPPIEYTVSFVTGFEGISLESQTWTENFFPGTLTYSGYSFAGWYLDADFTTPYTSSYTPTEDFTLYARWIENAPMDGFHNSLFGALEALFACEPIRYIFALFVFVIIIGLFKSRRSL